MSPRSDRRRPAPFPQRLPGRPQPAFPSSPSAAPALTLGATEPSESGLGGSVVMLIAPANGQPVLVHAPPEPLTPSGPGATLMRPSALAVLVHAWRRYGSGEVSWEELVEPARRAVE